MAMPERIALLARQRRTPAFVCILLLTLFLAACSPALEKSRAPLSPPAPSKIVTPAATAGSPPATPGAIGCYYAWATRELPDLSETVQISLGRLDGDILASAYSFGEECRADDGTVSFLPMETDFRVRVPVTTLEDEAALGVWISRVMSVLETLPVSDVPGPRPGRVEFEFHVDESTALRLTVGVSRYHDEAVGLDAASVFELFRRGP